MIKLGGDNNVRMNNLGGRDDPWILLQTFLNKQKEYALLWWRI